MKTKTNQEAFKALIKRLDKAHPFMYALLRERVLHIMNMTVEDIKYHPERWENCLISSDYYVLLDKIVKENLEFND